MGGGGGIFEICIVEYIEIADQYHVCEHVDGEEV